MKHRAERFPDLPAPAAPAAPHAWLGERRELPILLYHRIVDAPLADTDQKHYVTTEELRFHLRSLSARGFQPVTFADLIRGVRVARPVILSFDDGFRDCTERVAPLFEAYNARAVVYCLGNRSLDHNDWELTMPAPAPLLSSAELHALHASGRFEIGSHGFSHRALPELADDALAHEVQGSKHALEEVLGAPVVSFSYPYGRAGLRESRAVEAAGYRFAVVTSAGPVRPADDWYRLRRIRLRSGYSRLAFWKRTSGFYHRYRRWIGR